MAIRRMRRSPSPERVAGFAAAGRRLRTERAAAAITVEPLLRATPIDEWARLANDSRLQTCGALERLAKIANDALTARPEYAHAVAALAVAVTEAMPPDAYHAIITAPIWAHARNDLGKALRYLGRNDEAIEAITQAEELISDHAVLAYDHAIIRFNKAVTLQELGRYSESLALLEECKHLFRKLKDIQRLVLCGLAHGVLLQRLGHHRDALDAYLFLVASGNDIQKETRAALHRAIGFCYVELGQAIEAEVHLLESIDLHRELVQPIEALKSDAVRGRLFLRIGDPDRAIRHLRPIRRDFLRNSLIEEAGICGLEITEALLVLERAAEAENLARKIVDEFVNASLNTRAVTALGYLTEAIAARKASASLVNDVREYVLSLRSSPEREFNLRRGATE
jgi:tetratricopeptide (TPR) repeat protein